MIIFEIIAIWFYYSFWFLFISFGITLVFNRVFIKLWLSPMVINAIGLITLLMDILSRGEGTQFFEKMNWYLQSGYAINIWMIYLPVVFASVITNCIILLIRIIKKKYKAQNQVA